MVEELIHKDGFALDFDGNSMWAVADPTCKMPFPGQVENERTKSDSLNQSADRYRQATVFLAHHNNRRYLS